MILTVQQAETVYDLLVKHAGALPKPCAEHLSFVQAQSGHGMSIVDGKAVPADHIPPPLEYRICHAFGFGGKFWNDGDKLWVSCYPEDRTEIRSKQILELNAMLLELVRGWRKTDPSEPNPERSR